MAVVGNHGVMPESAGLRAPVVDVSDNQPAQQYEARVDGALAGVITYTVHGDRVAFTHAEVLPRWRGRGIASALVREALDDAVAHGRLITPLCPFVVGFVRKHEEYQRHVDAAHRSRYLPTTADGSPSNGDEEAGHVPTDV
jgi:uncharacterized protein